MENQITFQVLVDVSNKDHLSELLVLPKLVKNKLAPRCKSVRLVDCNQRSYIVRVVTFGKNKIMLTGGGWEDFHGNCIEPGTKQLCFRLRHSHIFDVVVFDGAGKQILRDANGEEYVNRCIILVSGETTHTEYPPLFFLDDLNVRFNRDTDKKAAVFGPNQIEDVEVIYEDEIEHTINGIPVEIDPDVRLEEEVVERTTWRAVGFTGSKWTNLCYQHDVTMGGHIMLTNLGEGRYLFDYFNEGGVGSAAATTTSRDAPQSVQPTLSTDYMTESDGEDVESKRHRCQIAGHQHNNDRPFFMKNLTEHSFTTNLLTVPNNFVRRHALNFYTKARVYVGNLKFKAKLDIMYDGRKDGDQSHVVLHTDWSLVSKKTGYVGGKELRFELNVVQCVDGAIAEFHVC